MLLLYFLLSKILHFKVPTYSIFAIKLFFRMNTSKAIRKIKFGCNFYFSPSFLTQELQSSLSCAVKINNFSRKWEEK